MADKKLFRKIYIYNRETGNTDYIIETEKQYRTMYDYMLTLNDVKTAVSTFSEMWNEPSNKFLKDFDLIELINCFSTRYIAKKGRI